MRAILEEVDLSQNMDIEKNLFIMIGAGKDRIRFAKDKHSKEAFLEFENKIIH